MTRTDDTVSDSESTTTARPIIVPGRSERVMPVVGDRPVKVHTVDTKVKVEATESFDLVYRGKSPGAYVPGADWRIWLRYFENFLTLRKVTEEETSVPERAGYPELCTP